jgi:hypothetical protein
MLFSMDIISDVYTPTCDTESQWTTVENGGPEFDTDRSSIKISFHHHS